MTKLVRSFFRPGQCSGHQRSLNVKFCRFQHFSSNRHIIREPEELQRHGKAHSIALLSFNAILLCVLRFDLRLTVWSPEGKNSKNNSFLLKRFSAITFDSVKTQHSFCQHRISLFKTRRMNYSLTLKNHFEKLTSGQGHDLIGKGPVAIFSPSVWSALTHLWYFHRFSWSLSKVITEKLVVTFHDLK